MLEPSANPIPCLTDTRTAPPAARSLAVCAWQRVFWGLAASLLLAGAWVQWAADSPAWMRFFHQHRVFPDALWANLTLLGFGWVILVLVGALDRRNGQGTLGAVLALFAGGACVQLVKAAFSVARPALVMSLGEFTVIGTPVLHSGSMPSGHAAAAGATATLLILLLKKQHQLTRSRLLALITLFALVAWSRVAVGAHWPADVLVGSGLGMMCGALCWYGAGRLLGTPAAPGGSRLRHRWLWMCAVDLLAAALCFGDHTGYPQALSLQHSLGVLAIGSALLRLHLWWRAGQRP